MKWRPSYALQPVTSTTPPPRQLACNVGPSLFFHEDEIRIVAQQVLTEKLREVTYNAALCKEMSRELARTIMERCKGFASPNYKVVIVVSIGSLKEKPGMQFGSRCLWNKDTDRFVSAKFMNSSIFSVAMIYGLYFQ